MKTLLIYNFVERFEPKSLPKLTSLQKNLDESRVNVRQREIETFSKPDVDNDEIYQNEKIVNVILQRKKLYFASLKTNNEYCKCITNARYYKRSF